ncbi:uncharacterized protein LOC141608671 [Silene latifolia]|uniref:uncharacterized protein LOC141608671 n=1 Tax=Silene latifolia TaxID=37657 RepID=UPI003D77660A
MTKIGDSLKGGESESGYDKMIIPPSSPLFLHPSDSPSLKLTQTSFNGENYDLWADVVRNGLDAKNKLGFVDGTVTKPTDKDSYEAVAWRQCQAMIKAWLRSVIDEKLHSSITFNGATVVEIWKELQERYSAGNAPRIHQLKCELTDCKQGSQSVVEYYTHLKSIWDELDKYSRVPDCTCGAKSAFVKEKEEEKVHQFIMGLNTTLYEPLRSHLLMDDNLTSLSRAYALVLREERHKAVTRIREEQTEAAMAVRTGGSHSRGRSVGNDQKEYEPPRCTHCNKWYHTEENCWDKLRINGRGRRGNRGGGRGGRGSRGEVAHATTTNEGAESSKKAFTDDEVEQLRGLLNAKSEGNEKLSGPIYENSCIVIFNSNCIVTFNSNCCMTRVTEVAAKTGIDEGRIWHQRLGHPSRNVLPFLSTLIRKPLSNNSDFVCDPCCRAKQTRSSFKLNDKRNAILFHLIHCDIWGPYKASTLSGSHYFLTIVYDHSRSVWVHLMKDRGEVGDLMKYFCKMVHTQFGKQVKIVQSDNGTEFLSGPLKHFYSENGMVFQTSMIDTPQQNGRVERKHRHILEKARALRFQANLPIHFWGECVLTAAYLINRTPTKILAGRTPYELLHGEPPSLDNLRVFGCLAYAHNKTKPKDKFKERGTRCIFIGYPKHQKGWKLYDLKTRKQIESRDVIFHEHVFPYDDLNSTSKTNDNSNTSNLEPPDVTTDFEYGEENFEVPPNIHNQTLPQEPIVDNIESVDEGNMSTETEEESDPHDQGESDNAEGVEKLGKGERQKFEPAWKKDYICKSTRVITTSAAHSTSTPPSVKGTRYPIIDYVTSSCFSVCHRNFIAAIDTNKEPKNYFEAVKKEEWRLAMASEIEALEKNGTWKIVD